MVASGEVRIYVLAVETSRPGCIGPLWHDISSTCTNVAFFEDEEGTELPDLAAARTVAIHGARDLMCAEVSQGHLCLACSIEVRDGDGAIVLQLPFSEAIEVRGQS